MFCFFNKLIIEKQNLINKLPHNEIEHRIIFPKSYPFSIVIAIMFNI